MSRRDIIIIASLINTGLLAVLFMMAVQVDEPGMTQILEPIALLEQPSALKLETPLTETRREEPAKPSRDEIDEVLKNYVVNQAKAANERPLIQEDSKDVSASLSQEEFVQIKVKKGDVLEKIAKANGTTVGAILRANRLASERLSVGQTLLIPIPKKKDAVSSPKTTRDTDAEYYTMKSGDNPWKIAKQFHVRMDELLSLNNLDETKARNLKPGDVLRVR